MEHKPVFNKRSLIIGILVLFMIFVAVFSFLNRDPGYYNAIHIRFEEVTPTEQELLLLEQYDNAILLDADDPILHDYTLIFPKLSQRQVLDIVTDLNNSEGVWDASYIRVINYPDESS